MRRSWGGRPGGLQGLGGVVVLVLSAAITLAVGCGSAESGTGEFDSESVIQSKSCSINDDQRGAFMARVEGFPLSVGVDSDFTTAERMAIDSAFAQWNQLGRSVIGEDFFQVSYTRLGGGASSNPRMADPRDCSSKAFGSARSFSIVRENNAPRWKKLGFSDAVPGATLRCFSGREVIHQVVLIYGNVINRAQLDPSQLSSVILHELGHAVGLDHSCLEDGAARKRKFAQCAGLADSHPYHQAVMYPVLRTRRSESDQPEVKDTLRANDTDRTKCLYSK